MGPLEPPRAPTAVTIGSRSLTLSNLGKVMYPATGFTKGEVIDYYARVAGALLPHLKGRPVTLKRYPDGVEAPFFYEKNCPAHRPGWVKTAGLATRSRGTINLCVVDSLAALMWIANLGSIELHPYLSKAANVDRPTMLVLDLDPGPGAGVRECARVALRLRELLKGVGLAVFAKSSGGKGVHLAVPLNTAVGFAETKAFAHALARAMEGDDPRGVTAAMRKDLRAGRVFIDWSQNDRHKTTVGVYSLRAQREPSVSAPVAWEEVEEAATARKGGAAGLRFGPAEALERLDRLGDLFRPALELRQRLGAP